MTYTVRRYADDAVAYSDAARSLRDRSPCGIRYLAMEEEMSDEIEPVKVEPDPDAKCWYCNKPRTPGDDCPCGAPPEMPEHWMEDY